MSEAKDAECDSHVSPVTVSDMASIVDTITQKSANLARIRDNQRRSRARRKDYLKELETRYRNCEQVGVSASTEIQTAAKSVVEENRRLRSLLRAYGASDAEIDGASGRQGSVAADMLEIMSTARQPCGPGEGCQPLIEPPQQLRPVPAVQTKSTCPPASRHGSIMEAHSAVPIPQHPNSVDSPARIAEYRQQSGNLYSPIDQESLYFVPQGYGMPAPPGQLADHQQIATTQMAPHIDVQYSGHGHSSCQVAADTIRTFSPMAGYELEQELGCRAPGEECDVPNSKIFNVIDRYTAGAG